MPRGWSQVPSRIAALACLGLALLAYGLSRIVPAFRQDGWTVFAGMQNLNGWMLLAAAYCLAQAAWDAWLWRTVPEQRRGGMKASANKKKRSARKN